MDLRVHAGATFFCGKELPPFLSVLHLEENQSNLISVDNLLIFYEAQGVENRAMKDQSAALTASYLSQNR